MKRIRKIKITSSPSLLPPSIPSVQCCRILSGSANTSNALFHLSFSQRSHKSFYIFTWKFLFNHEWFETTIDDICDQTNV